MNGPFGIGLAWFRPLWLIATWFRPSWFRPVVLVLVAFLPTATFVQPSGAGTPRLLWGVGDQIAGATRSPLYQETPVNMVTSWYNGPADLSWMKGYANTDTISNLYGKGDAQELVVWLANHPQYAVSDQFQKDLTKLVTIFKGQGPHYGPLYIVLFTELETYSSAPGYRAKLKRAYLRSVKTIHAAYPNARVALGFGGYGWTSPYRDLTYWDDAIAASDFTAVQAMHACDNVVGGQNAVVQQIRDSVRQLGTYYKPVMVSHFTIWGSPACRAEAMRASLNELFSQASLSELRANYLFAFDFMSNPALSKPGPALSEATRIVRAHAATVKAQ